MQKATPLILVLILAVTAAFLSLRPKEAKPADPVLPTAAENKPVAVAPPAKNETPASELVKAREWPQATSDIKPDAGATFGVLPNGFRYIIYPNTEPPKRVSMRLHVAAGSLMEADDQQGLAHFLEHMVFNGSKHFTAKELIPRMQRLGIAFGAHANAYTSFDETVYMLDLPDLSPDTMDLGFTVMRDFGDGAKLEETEINRERGVILSEKASRDSVGYRLMEQQYKAFLPGSLVPQRFPIGQEDVIQNAQRDRFVDFYSRYYVPERMTFIIVGDIDAAEMTERIESVFGDMKNPENPGANPTLGEIKSPEGIKASIFADKEVESTEVSLMLTRPYVKKPDTAANREAKLPLALAHAMIGRRFDQLALQENSSITKGSAGKYDLFNYLELGSIDVTVADDRWQEAVPLLEQEFRRALDYGFTEAELAEAKANVLNAYEQAVKQKPTRKSDGLARVLVSTINDDEVFSSPETDLELAKKALDATDLAETHDALKAFWNAPGYHLTLTTKEKPEGAEGTLASLYQESIGKPVEAPKAKVAEAFGYSTFGKSGTVVERKEVADLGITQLVLSNKVKVNLKPTDFDKNKIQVLARIGSGKLTQPKDSPMFDDFAAQIFDGGGLGKHSNDDLQRILAGKNVSSQFSIGEDAFSLTGSTTPSDFGLEMRLLVATLMDPGYRNEGLWQFQKAIPMFFQQLKHTTAGPEQEMNAWLHGNDSRFTVATQEKLSSYTIVDAKKWLTPELTKGYLELSIVGDFKVDEILPEILATFGAIPTRAATPAQLDAARVVKFPNAPGMKTFTYDSKIPQAVATVVWKTEGMRNHLPEFRRLNILGSIYGNRLREEIREKLGASYSPNAGASGSDALEAFGYVIGQSEGKPADMELLLKTMRDLGHELAEKGATEDELERALKPVLGMLEKSSRENSYWLGTVMSQSQAEPKRLDLARQRDSDYRSITLKEINAAAKKYLSAENALQITIKPNEAP